MGKSNDNRNRKRWAEREEKLLREREAMKAELGSNFLGSLRYKEIDEIEFLNLDELHKAANAFRDEVAELQRSWYEQQSSPIQDIRNEVMQGKVREVAGEPDEALANELLKPIECTHGFSSPTWCNVCKEMMNSGE